MVNRPWSSHIIDWTCYSISYLQCTSLLIRDSISDVISEEWWEIGKHVATTQGEIRIVEITFYLFSQVKNPRVKFDLKVRKPESRNKYLYVCNRMGPSKISV